MGTCTARTGPGVRVGLVMCNVLCCDGHAREKGSADAEMHVLPQAFLMQRYRAALELEL